MTARGSRRQDRQARRRQIQPYLDEWDRDRSDQRRLVVAAVVTGVIFFVGLIRWLWL